MLKGTARESAAEFLGTFVLIAFGTGVVAEVVLSGGANGSALSIHLAWGLGVMLGIYVAGGVSGAHLNPAVTLALAALRGFPWRKLPAYVAAQVAGAFAGASVTFVTYRDAFDHFDGGVRQVTGPQASAGIFSTYPQPYLGLGGGFVDQVVGTALLMLGIFAIADRRNAGPPAGGPVLVGALVAAIGMSFGLNAGYAINPARDLGPRLFTSLAGWGGEVFRAGGGWWWVPIVAPCVGAVLGGLVYDVFITRHHPAAALDQGRAAER
jgi:MIP family channel proteins